MKRQQKGQQKRKFDVVLFGATGFTGRLVAEYLAERVAPDTVRWALAGRDLKKLEAVRADLAAKWPHAAALALLVADSADDASLANIAGQTQVVCTTVGPYAQYGSGLVAACVAAGTDYCDLTGEVQWIRRMVDQHHDAAVAAGARIVHCCGFDSIPSDLGTLLLQRTAIERHGRAADAVTYYLRRATGGFSGGTVASMLNLLSEARDPAVRRVLGNPYAINPPDQRRGPDRGDQMGPKRDAAAETWTAPFVMAGINTRVVRRSAALLGQPWGAGFRYAEVTDTGGGVAGMMKAAGMSAGIGGFIAVASVGPLRRLLAKTVLPAPGQGPSREAQERGRFWVDLVGRYDDGTPAVTVTVKGSRDPGYGATAAMLAESALALVETRKTAAPHTLPAGVLTPATALGEALITRLNASLVTFAVQPA